MRGETVAIIPARGGSKGVPRKNTLRVGGIPLVARAVRAAHEAPAIDRVVVTTDDDEIAEIADNLITSGQVQPTRADVAVAITKLINELPGERDMELVRQHLEAAGFPPSWGDEDGAPGAPPGPGPDPAGKDGRDR